MKTESAQLLMNRYLDGVATAEERAQLARALKADPMLRSEFEDLESVHASTESLFRQLRLPEDFSARVMRRVQHGNVPSDESLEAVRLPAQRPLGARPRAAVTHRKRARVYAIIATISAAAAVMLAIGVFSGFFARAGIGTEGVTPVDQNLAEGRQGGPDRGELNRTDSSSLPPSKTDKRDSRNPRVEEKKAPEQPAPVKPEPKEDVQPEPMPTVPEEVVDQPEPKEPEVPDVTDPQPLPEPEEVVDHPEPPEPVAPVEPEPVQPRQPEEVVETKPEDNKTEAVPADRIRIGRMLILNGKAELVDAAGAGKSLSEEHELFVGDRIRTNVNGLVLLRTENGDLTLHYKSEVTLNSPERVLLQGGTVALDRNDSHVGSDMAVQSGAYTLYLTHGCATMERKRRGLVIQKAFGFASVSHDEFGTALLDDESGHEVAITFGKPVEDVSAKLVRMPSWSAKSRAKSLLMAIDEKLEAREYPAREFAYVESRLPNRAENLMANAVHQDTVVDFFNKALDNQSLDGASLILMVTDVEAAYLEVTELSPDVITGHAGRAALVAESFDQWKEYFYRLMRPPVEPKNPPQPIPTKGGTTECPNDDKLKRVENPPPKKKIVKVPNEPEKPAEEPAEEDKPSS